MLQRQKTNSIFELGSKHKRKVEIEYKRKVISKKGCTIGISIGVFLTLITIILQSIAFFTPHWKEISPKTHSLYVDGVDALIRTEILHYFDTVHRYSRQSYGLFQRCEYLLKNVSQYINNNNHNHQYDLFNKQINQCTKNYLPSYHDEYFNECHSLPYYRFCAKTSEKNFDINNDYLRATFDIAYSQKNSASKFSCDCHYPPYVIICHIIGIIALILLIITLLLYTLFPFFTNEHHRLKIKCFAVLSSVIGIIFLIINLAVILQHSAYELIEYLVAIQKHYRVNQIYKLSQDTKQAIDLLLSSIEIRIGYSTILAWIALVLSIVDLIFILLTCKIRHEYDDSETHVNLISSQNNEANSPSSVTGVALDFQPVPSPPPPPPPAPSSSSSSKFRNERSRVEFEDQV